MVKTAQNAGSQQQAGSTGKLKSPEKDGTSKGTKVGSPPLDRSSKKSIVTVADVHTPSEPQEALVTSVQPEIATVVISESVAPKKDSEDLKEAETAQLPPDTQSPLPANQKIPDEQKSTESNAAKPTEPSSIQDTKAVQSSVVTVQSPERVTIEGNVTKEEKDAKEGSQSKADETKQLKEADSGQIDDQSAAPVATEPAATVKASPPDEIKETKPSEKAIESKDSPSVDTKPSVQIDDPNQGEKRTDATDDKNANIDASKSFQVLPVENQPSDNLNQGIDDTGNLGPPKPPTETIRKTSFTVLKSDDDLLAGMDENQNKEMANEANEKTLTRPKSFKVLKAHDASGEDIILHQSSDQEVGGDVNFDDYLNRNVAFGGSGKYSDSELVKSDGQFNGRRKKYKKRAKSVKQLTIVDGLSKDQDSGFEPSPRTLRSSQKNLTTRAIYTANLPERPRVGDIIDGRSASSRFDQQRKLGDKNACNMTTVSQTLQRNIRR